MDEAPILAIDPGLSGALAFLDPAGRLLHVADLPTFGAGASAMIDAPNLAAIVREYRPARAIVEQVSSMPKEGVSSAHRFGRAVGSIAGVLGALGVPVEWVTPSKWTRGSAPTRKTPASGRSRRGRTGPSTSGGNRTTIARRQHCSDYGVPANEAAPVPDRV
jgi:crossover junction endodeoxyribonuclease RuvC